MDGAAGDAEFVGGLGLVVPALRENGEDQVLLICREVAGFKFQVAGSKFQVASL